MSPQKRTIAERVNDYLAEPDGQQFVNGKWKFWFVAIAFLSVVNAALTWLIFRDDAENYSGPIMLSVGALVAWLCVGALHYSDSANRQLARGVSIVDSIALLFVVIHFSGLLYVYGHHRTLQRAETKYEQQAERFNAESRQVQDANVKIAEAAQTIAKETTKAERLRNDAAYQMRKAAEAGLKAARSSARAEIAPSIGAGLATSAVELERPVKPTESSAAFLARWDWLIRLANCGELLLACLTLILIRNVSARSNSPREFPLSFSTRSATPQPAFKSDTVSLFSDDTDAQRKTTRVVNREGLKRLRETLKEIGFQAGKTHFKVDPKPDGGYLWIRQFRSEYGEAKTVGAARAKLQLLDDAVSMPREEFRERLERFLRENGFEV
jgi:hypothetical protein